MIPYIGIGVLALGGLVLIYYIRHRGPTLEAIDGLPMTRLQRRAWWSLALSLVFTGALVLLFTTRGVQAYDSDSSLRFLVYGLFICPLLANLLIDPFGLPDRDGSGQSDERDVRVLERAPRVQSVAMILTLAVWMICLSLGYHDTGAIPMIFIYLIFFSALLANGLGLSLGIILGYRKMVRYGEG
ncbi:MAG TPA: hypothetical protein QGF95_10715 [Candidatus Latescibacteria bacterium]|jgi:hypothetical protein|nr:hypothetical protein [Gemmatimonadaceae bacterium]MDP6016086.1 hypothetical protein [Candidatus Latescibacterota bacterium]HJP31015.1 hypothetical protein [Candidatus Latescibacterota bacterium]